MKKFIISACTLLVLLSFGLTAHAEEPPFSIKPVLPNNQDANITDYISVSSEDTLSQEFEFIITNNTGKSMELKIEPLNALTSPNGVIQYVPTLEEKNSFLMKEPSSFKQYVDIIDRVVVESGTTKIVKATVDIPKLDGTVLGAIAFQTVTEATAKETNNAQFKVKNEANYIIGVQVNFGTDKVPKFILGDPFIDAMPSYYAIRLPITLDSPLLLKGVSLDYKVWNHDGEEIFGSKIGKPFNFAPESKANIAIPWEHEELTEGKEYRITGKLTYDGKEFPFDESFIYTKGSEGDSTNNGLNKPTVNESNALGLIIGLAAATGIMFFIFWKRRNQYVLYNDEPETVEVINEEHELFKDIKHIKEAKNEDESPYMHYYKPIKKRKKIVGYKFKKTKKLESKS